MTASKCNSLVEEQHRKAPAIPIHTMLSPEESTASWNVNLSRERFVPLGRTLVLVFGARYSQF